MSSRYTSTFRLRCPTTGAQVVLQPDSIPRRLVGQGHVGVEFHLLGVR